MNEHKITCEQIEKNNRWIAICSCGRWRSSTYILESDAESAGEGHKFRGDSHLTALAQFTRGRTAANLRSELKWYEDQAEDPFNSEKDRKMWKILADELRPRVVQKNAEDDDQMLLWAPEEG